MHSIAEVGTNVPAFLGKLWKMVEDPVTNDLISWSSNGTSFVIKDEIRFARELLPMYYKHNNMASFIRQLNMYGFHKIVSPEAGAMKLEAPDEIQFSHPFFIRGHSYLLDDIKRKITVSKTSGQLGEKSTTQVLGKVLTDVRQMKGRQENMDSKLTAMKLENGALWRELSVLRQKHIKQQQMVNKLIQFLVTLVHQNPKLFSMKRKYPRMLHENNLIKMAKHKQHEDNANNISNRFVFKNQHNVSGHKNFCSQPTHSSPIGPIIHELDPAEALMDTVAVEAEVETEPVSPSEQVSHYFLNESGDDIEDVVVEMPFTDEDNSNTETLIGIPEDTLNFEQNKDKKINTTKKSHNIVYSTEQGNKQPPVVKLVTGKQKNDNGYNQRIHKSQQIIMKNQQKTKQNLQYHIQMNQQLIQRNKEQIDRSEELKKNQQRILKSQQEIIKNRQLILKNRQEIISNQQEILENQEQPEIANTVLHAQNNQYQILKGNQQKIIRNQQLKKRRFNEKNQQAALLKNQQNQLEKQQHTENKQLHFQNSPFHQVPTSPVQNNQQQLLNSEKEILLENLQQEIQPNPESGTLGDPIILDDGPGESILGVDGNVMYNEPEEQHLDFPIIVEVPALGDLEEQQNSCPPVPQDLLLGSPLIVNDAALTPQNTATSMPIISSPSPSSSNMEVACLDEPEVTSSNIVTRSAYFSEEMDSHLDTMQSDLDNLKELLKSEGISLDANALLSCFSEDPLSYNISNPVPADDPNGPKESNGSELISYNPTLMDLTDLMGTEWSLPASPNEHQLPDNTFEEIHTPQFVPQSPSFPVPSKKRKT